MALGHGEYGDFTFEFRGHDLSALKEVLVDGEYAFLCPFIKENESPVIIDAGSHIGLFSFWVLNMNPKSRIFGIEASPATFEILKRNVEGNQRAEIKWQVINRAAWENSECIQFSDTLDSMSHRVSESGSQQVSGITLREVIEKASSNREIDLMKVDNEGAEEAFLMEEPEILKKVKRLVIELHPSLCNTDRVNGLLHEAFPIVEKVTGRTSSKPLLYCKK